MFMVILLGQVLYLGGVRGERHSADAVTIWRLYDEVYASTISV
jgi:hypothetical protein